MSQSKLGLAQPDQYVSLLEGKCKDIKVKFEDHFNQEITCFESEPAHFRMRAEFRVWHDELGAHYAMYEPGRYKQPVIIEKFDIGYHRIVELMPKLLERINHNETLRRKLFQVEFLTTLSGESLITLIYHKPLDNYWRKLAAELESDLDTCVIGRSRKQKEIISRDFVTETLALDVGRIHYKQIETGFTQPNAKVCIDMINWACTASKQFGGDLLELYCGNGNFTIPLSFHFEKVLATEVSKLSTRAAIDNIQLNKRENISLIRLSAEEVSEAMTGVREFRRLAHVNLSDYNFSTIFVDPPRAGIDVQTLSFMSQFENIIYISCNPETLKDNLEALSVTHKVTSFAIFDQFPYTHHCECGAILSKRK